MREWCQPRELGRLVDMASALDVESTYLFQEMSAESGNRRRRYTRPRVP
jgi:hypothetical protein